MTYWKNDPRTLSLANGTAATTTNTAAPDALTPTLSGTGTVTYQTGPGRWLCHGPASSVARLDKTINTTHTAVVARYDLTGQTPAATRILQIFNAGQTAATLGVGWQATGKLIAVDYTGALLWTSTGTYTGQLRVYFGAEIGSGTGDGEFHVKVYGGTHADTTTVDETFDSSVANCGTANYTSVRIGKITTAPVSDIPILWVEGDDAQYTETGLGVLTTGGTPAANAGADQTVEPYSTVTLTGTDTDPGGTISGRLWTQTSGPAATLSGATTATATFTAPAGLTSSTLTFQYTVTDSASSATASDSMNVAVLTTAERIMRGVVLVAAKVVRA